MAGRLNPVPVIGVVERRQLRDLSCVPYFRLLNVFAVVDGDERRDLFVNVGWRPPV
jgi:hypothetical protein